MKTALGTREWWERLSNEPSMLAAEVCSINIANLDVALQKHPALRAWVNAAHESARIAEERALWDVTRAKAMAMLEARETADASGKSKTVQVLDAEVNVNENVVAAMDRLLAAQEKRGALRAMTSALEDRKDMLIQISSNRRKEQTENR